MKRPEHDEYFMKIAMAARSRANCAGKRVGAVLVRDERVISTGYNGTPEGMMNCDEGGCQRCAKGRRANEGYDVCICVHAEQNALLSAARFGTTVEGACLYTTLQPCFGCIKELLQAKVEAAFFIHPWEPKKALLGEYRKIQAAIPNGIKRLAVRDPEARWANNVPAISSATTSEPVPFPRKRRAS
jgi:dCMP deaminase